MSVSVPLEALRAELAQRSNAGYLLTVGDDGRPHCVAAHVDWGDDELVVSAGRTSARNAAARRNVTLLAPPAATGATGASGTPLSGYSLIVDGDVAAADPADGGVVRVRPLHAVLHRPAARDGGHAHDCAHVFDEAGGAP
jgi:hypothetical protein